MKLKILLTTWITPVVSLIEFNTNSPLETIELGQKIAPSLRQGSVVAIYGGLGSGKTCLVKGIALGLGVEEPVTSPTYAIINEFSMPEGPHKNQILRHIDIYRISAEEFIELGGDELLRDDNISLIEWGERIEKLLPENTIRIYFKITGPLSRQIKIEGLDIR